MAVEEQLRQMLVQLEKVSADNEEIFDTECREQMGLAVMDGFVRGKGGNAVPVEIGLATDDANRLVHSALTKFVLDANAIAESQGLLFLDRLNELQNDEVATDDGNDYEEFFGHTPADFYDAAGNVVRTH
tara:strand:- start:574 stop:963 length:390 start_codon:yes stop_codon:yes gene_type:complete